MNSDLPHEFEITGSETDCSYLPAMRATMTYRLAMQLPTERYEALLSRGWRRFGRTLFRPTCAECRACQSLRVLVQQFKPSRSQRRILRNNADIEVRIQRPSLSNEHLTLYNQYHLDMHHRRKWPFREITREQYFESFLEGNYPFSREFQYRDAGRLIAVGLVDMTKNAMSSIYFYHDPAYRDASLGTYSVIREIEMGQQSKRHWLYMGYFIRECQSMNYKNRFSPHQILDRCVLDDEAPIWNQPFSEQDTEFVKDETV